MKLDEDPEKPVSCYLTKKQWDIVLGRFLHSLIDIPMPKDEANEIAEAFAEVLGEVK